MVLLLAFPSFFLFMQSHMDNHRVAEGLKPLNFPENP